jgi:hypothetical protein
MTMAEHSNLESKLGEVIGLAMAAQGATQKVTKLEDVEGDLAGHWEILSTLNEQARHAGVQELVEWGIPIQQRHFEEARQGSLKLAAEEDPNEIT